MRGYAGTQELGIDTAHSNMHMVVWKAWNKKPVPDAPHNHACVALCCCLAQPSAYDAYKTERVSRGPVMTDTHLRVQLCGLEVVTA